MATSRTLSSAFVVLAVIAVGQLAFVAAELPDLDKDGDNVCSEIRMTTETVYQTFTLRGVVRVISYNVTRQAAVLVCCENFAQAADSTECLIDLRPTTAAPTTVAATTAAATTPAATTPAAPTQPATTPAATTPAATTEAASTPGITTPPATTPAVTTAAATTPARASTAAATTPAASSAATTAPPSASTKDDLSKDNDEDDELVFIIVGCVVGSLALILVLILIAVLVRRESNKRQSHKLQQAEV